MSTSSTAGPDPAAGRSERRTEPPRADAGDGVMPPSYPPGSAPRPEPAPVGGPPAPVGRTPGRARTPAPQEARRGGWFRESLTVMVCALVLSILIKTFLAQAFYIPSGSMENTLAVGDRVMVNKLAPGAFDLERGDVVVFVDPGGWLGELPPDTRPAWQQTMTEVLTFIGLLPQDAGHHLIKRIIGVGGDTVTCCSDDGAIMVNGEPIDEPYLKPGSEPSEMTFEVEVPEGHVWLMGDNRSNSEDSRAHLGEPGGGMVPIERIVGRAFVVLWPADRMKLLNNPEETFTNVPEPA